MTVLVVCGSHIIRSGVVAAFALAVLPSYGPDQLIPHQPLLFGAVAIVAALLYDGGLELPSPPERARPPIPVAGSVRRRARGAACHGRGSRVVNSTRPALEIDRMTVRFGGHVAVDDLSLDAPVGAITGLIGPNGAGKTTTFNAVSGLLRPAVGSVHFDGRDVTRESVAARARLGIGRTFQKMELYPSMSVADNVYLGAEVRRIGRNPWRQFVGRSGDTSEIQDAVDDAMTLCGIGDLADVRVDRLSTGQRRLTELARACAGRYRMLLLDEPSSGLDPTETDAFAAILRLLRERQGLGMLLVEHDMSLVMGVCDRIHVLDFGRKIFEGSPEQTRTDERVRAAYLGDDGVPAAASPDGNERTG